MRILALESRRAADMGRLIRQRDGEAFVAPSMRQIPLESNDEALAAGERLLAGEFDMAIFLTGVGVRALDRLLATRYPAERFREALRRLTVVARGPKPSAALREMGVPVHLKAPEPNTWRDVADLLAGRPEKSIAVQEYGRSNPRLLEALRELGARPTPIRIYQWALPEDTSPLREAARGLVASRFDVVLFTTPNQVLNLMQIAREEGIEADLPAAFERIVVASIGPSTTETLVSLGIQPDLEPTHPKMGILVKEAAEQATALLAAKTKTPDTAK